MKKSSILTALIVLIFNICFAQNPTLNKLVEYPTCGEYFDKDQLDVIGQHLFAVSTYGLEIYKVEPNTPAQLLSRLPLLGDARAIEVQNNYAYVQSVSYNGEGYTILFKIDINNVNEPTVVQSIYNYNENGTACGDIYNDFIMLRNWDNNYNYYYSIYSIPELEFIQNYYYTVHFMKLNDSLAFGRFNGEIFTLYDMSDPEDITEIEQVDFSAGGIPIDNIQAVNDTILACLDFDGVSFWNYSDIYNIQYKSTVYSSTDEYWGRYLYNNENYVFVSYLPTSDYPGLKSINISDIYNPFVTDDFVFPEYGWFHTCIDVAGVGNCVFTGEYSFMNQVFCNNGYFSEHYIINEHYGQYGGAVYNEYLYVIFNDGLKIYDVSSLPDVVHVNTVFEDHPLSSLQRIGNLLVFIDKTDYEIIVMDVTNPTSPTIRNQIPIPPSWGWILLTKEPYCLYYLERSPGETLIKYSIPEPDNYTVDLQYDLDYDGNGFIYNDQFYYIAENSGGPDLQIYDGLEENNLELIMTYEDFAEGYYGAYIQNCDSLFYLSTWDDLRDSTRFYEIGETTEITYRFSTPHRCDGEFFIDGDCLFTGGKFSHIYIFDLETSSGLVEPIADYQDYGSNLYCKKYESNEQKYLYHFQSTAFSIYEIQGYGVDDEPEAENEPIICRPNPFSTSTTISFSGKFNSHQLSQIKIYNIKGQLVRELLPVAPSPGLPVSVIWDGKDEKGKDVSADVYLYKIGDEDGFVGKVVKLK